MNWTDEEIDKLFGEAANKQVFEYRPEYWNDIEKQLPIKKQGKRAYWWWTANVFFLGFLGLIGLNVLQKTNVNHKNTSETNQTPGITVSQKVLKSNSEISTRESKIVVQKSAQTNNIDVKLKEGINDDLNVKTNVSINKFVKTENEIVNNNKPQSIDKVVADDFQTIENEEVLITQLSDEENKENLILNESINTNVDLLPEDKEHILLNTKALIFPLVDARLEPVSFPIEKESLRKMYIEFYGGVGQSYIKTNEYSNSVNASVGGVVGWTIPVNRFKVSVGLGFQASKFDQLNILERTKVYGFGSQILENSYEFSSIYTLTIPISTSFSMGRHSLNIGLNTHINCATQLKHIQSLDGNYESYNSGYSDVSFFNRFGLLPTLGYSFNVSDKTQIGARLNVQLLQQLQSNRFIGTPLNFPIDGQIYLKRTLNF